MNNLYSTLKITGLLNILFIIGMYTAAQCSKDNHGYGAFYFYPFILISILITMVLWVVIICFVLTKKVNVINLIKDSWKKFSLKRKIFEITCAIGYLPILFILFLPNSLTAFIILLILAVLAIIKFLNKFSHN